MLGIHDSFNLFNGFGNGFAEYAASGVGNQDVVFDANATEVLPFFEFVEVDEVLVGAFGMPFVNKGGDELAAGFVGDDEAWL